MYDFSIIFSTRRIKKILLLIVFVSLNILIYLPQLISSSEVKNTNIFTVDKDYIYLNGKKFLVKGINYMPEYPGELPWELNKLKPFPEKIRKRILNDIKNIKSLHANTIRFWGERPYPCFEGAKKEGLYIFLTIWINGDIKDYQSANFKNFQKKYIRTIIDQVHNLEGVDYSDIILAYAIGNELAESNIDSTDEKHPEVNHYKGKYITAPVGSTPTECFLAEMADYIKEYENDTYGVKHLVTYSNMQLTDPLLRCGFLDFISFNGYCHDTEIFSKNSDGSHTGTYYQGWLEKTRERFPNKPLLISEFGLSTAPECVRVGPPTYGDGGNTEEDQANGIAQMWNDIITAKYPVAGGIIFVYQDIWWAPGNIKEPFEIDKESHNENDVHEWYGIVGLEGKSPKDFKVKKRKAFYRVREMFKEGSDDH